MSEPTKAAMRAAKQFLQSYQGMHIDPEDLSDNIQCLSTDIDAQFADLVSALEWLTYDRNPGDKGFAEWFADCCKNARKVLKQIR